MIAPTPLAIPTYNFSSTILSSSKSPLWKDTSSWSSTMMTAHSTSSFPIVLTRIDTIEFTKTKMSSYSTNTSWPSNTYVTMKKWRLLYSAWTTLMILCITSLLKCNLYITVQLLEVFNTFSI